MKMKIDIAELANAFYKSFPKMDLNDLTLLGNQIVEQNDGLNHYRNFLRPDELDSYFTKGLDLVFLNNETIEEVSMSLLFSNLMKIGVEQFNGFSIV